MRELIERIEEAYERATSPGEVLYDMWKDAIDMSSRAVGLEFEMKRAGLDVDDRIKDIEKKADELYKIIGKIVTDYKKDKR